MTEPKWFTFEQAIAAHGAQLIRFGGASGLRDEGALRSALGGEVGLQEFGSPQDVLIRLERRGDEKEQQNAVDTVRRTLTEKFPGTELRRVESVGAAVSCLAEKAGANEY